MKRKIISAMSLLLVLCVMVMHVSALEIPDMNRTGSVSITMTYHGEPVAGGSLTIIRVADVHVENGADYSFRLTEAFADSQVSLEELGNSGTALALAQYADTKDISGTKLQIGQNGVVVFEELELGLYLLIQEDAPVGYELANPFLVSVPGRQNDSYIYAVDASPKLSLETAPTEPPTEPTTPPNLPQTGQLQWPVPVLAVMGALFVALGIYVHISEKRKHHEK